MSYMDSWGPADLSSRPAPTARTVPAQLDMVLEEVITGWVGAVVRVEKSGGQHLVELEDRRGRVKSFPLGPGFLLEGEPIVLAPPAPRASAAPKTHTASGSRALGNRPAQVAKASRIWVEGKHDADLVEKVWGDDLRMEGVVVEPLHGVDDLAGLVADFGPGPGRRLGILVDHLVEGSKEWRLAREVLADPRFSAHVEITGHPYVDIWQAVKPQVVGLKAWPVVPKGQPWKQGILDGLGWPCATEADVARGWRRILGSVTDYTHVEPELLGKVEQLIDFVTAES